MKPLILQHVAIGLRNGSQSLIAPLDLTVAPGEIATVTGPSGIGKSTLLAFIGGHLDRAFRADGRILIGDRDLTKIPAEKRRIGILFQDDLLFPHLSVGDNLAFGLRQDIRGGAERRKHVQNALEAAGLDGFIDRDPSTLSGGQRARVALMRTLLAEPEALLLDEPFSKLDSSLRDEFRSFVFAHARRNRLPVLLVTHDDADAIAAGGVRIGL
ncbi:ATP-binding cassette domain-containing protein [Rhizobium sp. TRM95796]|uniref:ATP-binding cassette domain-containing protein n=1 Tax=Rhizobium sp. TRM95796 TaxID=2979862 RepID=UPI0021E7AB86|nr:ATP-binding cassette domain-containing protein [Rhizobium sp. TRM95796]MCV3764737.1 ATP-binding cassette domain-containing protein [Rhizobium sp. TRM95796]